MTGPPIVLTTDLSAAAERAFEPTVELAAKLGARLVLLHVVHDPELAPAMARLDVEVQVRDALAKLESTREALSARAGDVALEIEVAVETGEDIARTIADFAADRGAEFIALSTHGRTGFRHLLLGSVFERVLRHARTPVICYHERR